LTSLSADWTCLVREQLIECILERATETNVLLASHDLSEIESFASHIAYMDQGRLQFVEEMTALSERFREVEVILDHPVDLPQDWPAAWLNPEVSTAVVRFSPLYRLQTFFHITEKVPSGQGIRWVVPQQFLDSTTISITPREAAGCAVVGFEFRNLDLRRYVAPPMP
jgi:hypothetical protein